MRTGRRASRFIRQFAGPGDGSGILCFKFWQLVAAGGCPYSCAYCFLQTTPWFRFSPDVLRGLVYTNVDEMLHELDGWLADPVPKMLLVGELQDGLAFDQAYEKTSGRPLTHRLIPRFAAQRRHRMIFLTKSTAIDRAIQLPPTDRVVFSWSVNADDVARRWERGAPRPAERFAAAQRMKAAGWPVRLRLDPMIPYCDWRVGYAATVDMINCIYPEAVTLGALRATTPGALRAAARANGRDDTIFDYFTRTRDPSGFKYRIAHEVQVEMFRFVLDRLAPGITSALCKEDRSLWRELGLPFRGCHCLIGPEDALVARGEPQRRPPSRLSALPPPCPGPAPRRMVARGGQGGGARAVPLRAAGR